MSECPVCGVEVSRSTTSGREPVYCSSRHRIAAFRRRQKEGSGVDPQDWVARRDAAAVGVSGMREKDLRGLVGRLSGNVPKGMSHGSALTRAAVRQEAQRRLDAIEHARIRYDVSEDPAVVRMRESRIDHATAEAEIRRHLRGEDEPVDDDRPSVRVQRSDADKQREAAWSQHDLGEDGMGGWSE